MWSATSGTRRFYDAIVENSEPRAKGRCLCGAVTYEVRGPMRDVSICHCVECRRWSGYLGAFSATKAENIVVDGDALRWAESPDSDRHFRAGFCGQCGSSLLLQSPDSEYVSVAVGTLDRPTGLRIAGHWYSRHAADYEELGDTLPHDDALDFTAIRWS